MFNYIVLMQVPIDTERAPVVKEILSLCSSLNIILFLPIDRRDDDSRIDCYLFDTDTTKEIVLQEWKTAFPGRAISIEIFNDDDIFFYVKKAAEIYQYLRLETVNEQQMHIRRHLMHYIFNGLGYNYIDEARFYLDYAEKYIIATQKAMGKIRTLLPT